MSKGQASFVWGFVWSVYMISASNCHTPYKKLIRIVKGPIDGYNKIIGLRRSDMSL